MSTNHSLVNVSSVTIEASVDTANVMVLKLATSTGLTTLVAGDTITVDSSQDTIGSDAVRVEVHHTTANSFTVEVDGAYETWLVDSTVDPARSWSMRELPATTSGVGSTNSIDAVIKAWNPATGQPVTPRTQVIIIKRRPT